MLTILTEIHLNDDGTVDEDSVGHVEADGKNSLVQELQVAASRLDRHWSVPEKKTNVKSFQTNTEKTILALTWVTGKDEGPQSCQEKRTGCAFDPWYRKVGYEQWPRDTPSPGCLRRDVGDLDDLGVDGVVGGHHWLVAHRHKCHLHGGAWRFKLIGSRLTRASGNDHLTL